MSEKSSSSDSNVPLSVLKSSKKKQKHGRVSDVAKFIRNHTYETGKPCCCKRFRCFEVISVEKRRQIIQNFNSLDNRNSQNSHLCGLIGLNNIYRRRPRQHEITARLRDNSYTYKVRIKQDDGMMEEIEICQKAFISLHGLTNRRIITLKGYLKKHGHRFADMRGKHKNRPHRLMPQLIENVRNHIKSFKGRKSHYSLTKSSKIYLPEELNVKKMHTMYGDKFPNTPISYESYRQIFVKDFNISFGYPRSDTCSSCDEHTVNLKSLQKKLKNTTENEAKLDLQDQIIRLENENKAHKLRAVTFYSRKRYARIQSRQNESIEAITMDFSKNLPTPNISTNDVYYKRQLTFVSFNIHQLSTNNAVFYTYPEIIAKKGADEVASLLHHFCFNILSQTVRTLEIFCDSCAGQNKNYTIIRFLHHLVHNERRFDKIKITFPIRGHSYLECDKDFALIKQKTRVEVPSQWAKVFKNARVKPSPFNVIECTTEVFHAWTKFLTPMYKKTCPFSTRPIKELIISHQHPRTLEMRDSYNGAMSSFVLIPPKPLHRKAETPNKLYTGLIPISKLKYDQLQELKKFVDETSQAYYTNLPCAANNAHVDDVDMHE